MRGEEGGDDREEGEDDSEVYGIRRDLYLRWLVHLPVLPVVYFAIDGSAISRLARVAGYIALIAGRPLYVALFDRLVHRPESDSVLFRGSARLWTGEPEEEWLWQEQPAKVIERSFHSGELRATRTHLRWIPGPAARARGARALVIPVSAVEGCALTNDKFGGHGEAFVEIAGDDWGLGFEVASANRLAKTLDRLFDEDEIDVDLTDGQAKPRWSDAARELPPEVPKRPATALLAAWVLALMIVLATGTSSPADDSLAAGAIENFLILAGLATVVVLALRPTEGSRLSIAASVLGLIVSLSQVATNIALATVESATFGALLFGSLYVLSQRKRLVSS